MRSLQDFIKRLNLYEGAVDYIHIPDYGCIAWQTSTGENVELLFIEVANPGHGHGTDLLKQMCQVIAPYNSVFVFRLASNESAGHFYRSLGFKEQLVQGLYKQDAVLGVVSYEELCEKLGV